MGHVTQLPPQFFFFVILVWLVLICVTFSLLLYVHTIGILMVIKRLARNDRPLGHYPH